jgi:hypothetical protein
VRNLCGKRGWVVSALGLVLVGLLVAMVLWLVRPGGASSEPRAWDDGTVRYYDRSGTHETVTTAVSRWNDSGAQVRLREVFSAREADVVIGSDDRKLRSVCGRDCLGYSFSIGRPSDGQTQVLLAEELSGGTRALSVWVAAHELGHVLGLEHRDGRACSLMSPHAFDTRCAPSLSAGPPTAEELACVPAPTDVEAAAQMYGGKPTALDARCR